MLPYPGGWGNSPPTQDFRSNTEQDSSAYQPYSIHESQVIQPLPEPSPGAAAVSVYQTYAPFPQNDAYESYAAESGYSAYQHVTPNPSLTHPQAATQGDIHQDKSLSEEPQPALTYIAKVNRDIVRNALVEAGRHLLHVTDWLFEAAKADMST